MADISVTQKHTLSREQAKEAAQKVADQLAETYDMTAEWNGDVLSFKRSGVSGTLTVYADEARVEITLGFLLKAFGSSIEAQVSKKMQEVFSGAA